MKDITNGNYYPHYLHKHIHKTATLTVYNTYTIIYTAEPTAD